MSKPIYVICENGRAKYMVPEPVVARIECSVAVARELNNAADYKRVLLDDGTPALNEVPAEVELTKTVKPGRYRLVSPSPKLSSTTTAKSAS